MNAQQWGEVESIFQQALEHPPAGRAAFLDSVCGNNLDLRRAVEEALQAYEAGTHELDAAVAEAVHSAGSSRERSPGSTVGAYRLDHLLGRGGMGEVYLAKDTRLGRYVALKFLHTRFTADSAGLERFRHEARIASTLNHPNIVTIYETGEDQGRQFIAAEYVEGKTLRELLASGPLPFLRALDVAIQTATALEAAHHAGIIHRDIKPENLMVRPDGYIKMLDFGLAKLLPERRVGLAVTAQLTAEGMILGTAGYTAPERARGESADARSDLFSLGVVIHEMLSGAAPFTRGTAIETLAALLEREPPSLAGREGIPVEVVPMVDRLLAKNPEERYASAADLLQDLRRLQRQIESGQRIADSAPPAARSITRRSAVGAGLGTAALAGAGFWWWRARNPRLQLDQMTVRTLAAPPDRLSAFLSPDGNQVMMVRDQQGLLTYWLGPVTDLTQARLLRTARDEAFWGASFSPDGRQIYLTIEDLRHKVSGRLIRIPLAGGPGELVLESIISSAKFRPDGRRMAFIRTGDPGQRSLCTAAMDGSDVRVIGTGAWNLNYGALSWGTDGRSLVYSKGESTQGRTSWRLFEIREEGRAARSILPPQNATLGSSLVPLDERFYAFLMNDPARRRKQIYFAATGERPQLLTHDVNDYTVLQTDAEHKKLLATVSKSEGCVWILDLPDLSRAATGPQPAPRKLPLERCDALPACWSPSGNLLYHSVARGVTEIWTAKPDGSEARPLMQQSGPNEYPSVTSDGRYIVFEQTTAGEDQIWRANSDGSNPLQLSRGGSWNAQPRPSHDGRWVYFVSDASTGWSIYRVSIDGGAPELFVRGAYNSPLFSADGKWIVYTSLDAVDRRIKVLLRRLEEASAVQYLEDISQQNVDTLQFTLDSRYMIYLTRGDGFSEAWLRSIEGGAARRLFRIDVPDIAFMRLSPDGRRLALTTRKVTSELVMFENFR